jgi:translation initiation factor IF-1
MAVNSNIIRAEGDVLEALPGLLFRVKLRDNREILAHLAGKLKINHIKVIPGDRVIVEMAGPNESRGRIVRRM